MSRLFSNTELEDIAQPPEAHAIEALRRGDLAEVRVRLKEMARGHAGLDALSCHALARKAGKLRQDFGEQRALEALREIGTQLMATWIEQWRQGDAQGAIQDLVAVFRHQVGAGLIPIKEEADTVTLELAPCGSGGRLDRQGLPERHPQAYGDWGDGINSLCQACKANQAALNDALGEPVWTSEKGSDGHCTLRFSKGAQCGQTLFSDEQRVSITRTRIRQAEDKLDQGDTDIEALLDGQRKEWMPWHDFGVVWLAHFYAVALELGGADYLDEMLAETYEPAFVAGFPAYAALDDEALAREIARTWNYHCADFQLSEEDDRFVFTLDPCGSGGRLFRGTVWRDMFQYGRPLSPIMSDPHRINFLREDAPSYCTHCAASNRAQLSRLSDAKVPLFFVIDGHAQQRPGMPCRTYVYKHKARRADVDPALLRQVGLTPPSSAKTRNPS
ncbi:hypothetical protein MA04_01631 [Alcanivorax balearicus MACL04]|uniref:Uncharacterized protein n=1 Tax=Alloalcanivorax balearicus MACL04 TaxID=1177182 RepID=A0ABT2QXT9_9GAMM|nr:hypothetical protein [Alloalcanivorax balearicus]MCU5782331.1 hypothetical protein [Alloalcanivorax balearicus MACL04]